ncbi:MAG: hypothetical protein WDN31_01330 [Hyphomicrobium sp.]
MRTVVKVVSGLLVLVAAGMMILSQRLSAYDDGPRMLVLGLVTLAVALIGLWSAAARKRASN